MLSKYTRLLLICLVWSIFSSSPSLAKTYYVSPDGASVNPGTAELPWSLSKANSSLLAGDTAILTAGTYSTQIAPKNSGAPGAYITYQGQGVDLVKLTGVDVEPGILLNGVKYIKVDSISSDWVHKHVWIQYASYNIISNCLFQNVHSTGGSKSGILIEDNSRYNKILNNRIEHSGKGGDSLVIRSMADGNLIEGNQIIEGGHACWAIRGSSYNILRNNYFINPIQKIGEIYDQAAHLDRKTERNVIEGNIFGYLPPHKNRSPFSGIQYAGQYGIIRRNVFYDASGPAIRLGLWSGEARRDHGNRIFHNVFFANRGAGINTAAITKNEINFSNNVIVNNIFYKNSFVQQDFRFPWYGQISGMPIQFKPGRLDGYLFVNNNVFSELQGEDWLITAGWREALTSPSNQALTWWEDNYPILFKDNISAEPMFVDAQNKNFQLTEASAMINAGKHLTYAVSQGSGNKLVVADAGYFCNGFGIEGVAGDLIRIEGQSQSARLLSVDYSTDTLILDRPMEWTAGQGVSLDYSGSAPDLGAFEYQPAAR